MCFFILPRKCRVKNQNQNLFQVKTRMVNILPGSDEAAVFPSSQLATVQNSPLVDPPGQFPYPLSHPPCPVPWPEFFAPEVKGYCPGYMLSADDLDNLCSLLLGEAVSSIAAQKCVQSATSYDLASAQFRRFREQIENGRPPRHRSKLDWNMWVLFPTNTSSCSVSTGHWVLSAFRLHESDFKVHLIDPLSYGRYSSHVYDSFVRALGNSRDCVAWNLAGTQEDEWTCGYQVLWFILLFLLPDCDRMYLLDEMTVLDLPAPPSDWPKVVWLLLSYLQDTSNVYLMDIVVVNRFFADHFHLPFEVLKFTR